MKRVLISFMLCCFTLSMILPSIAMAYNFGDFRSETLVTKAWGALKEEDLEAVLAYTNKCLELYADQARKMQDSLEDYPKGENEEIFAYWALNDVATALFIQGEAFRRANMEDESIEVFYKLINEFSFGQAWDANGWFWKPAEAAREKLAMIDSGQFLDFGDYSSAFLTSQAWKVLSNVDKEGDAVFTYCNKVFSLYNEKAKEMQDSLTEYPWQSRDHIFRYWALNDVGTCYFIIGEAYKKIGDNEKAIESYQKLIEDFYYAQCWDPNGWFWKPAEAAQEALDKLSEK